MSAVLSRQMRKRLRPKLLDLFLLEIGVVPLVTTHHVSSQLLRRSERQPQLPQCVDLTVANGTVIRPMVLGLMLEQLGSERKSRTPSTRLKHASMHSQMIIHKLTVAYLSAV